MNEKEIVERAKILLQAYVDIIEINNEVNVPNEKPITPCQSILVKTIKSGEIMVNKTNQKPSQKYEDYEMLLVKVSNKDYEDKAYVSFGEGYGLEKVNHQNKDVPMIYFPIADVNYAIAVLDTEVKEVPLSFEAKIMGEYTISVETEAYDEIYAEWAPNEKVAAEVAAHTANL